MAEHFDIKNHKILWMAPITVCLIAVLPLPIGFYTFTRLIVFTCACLIAYSLRANKEEAYRFYIFVAIALLFNPIEPVYLESKFIWTIFDITTAGIFYTHYKKTFTSSDFKLPKFDSDVILGTMITKDESKFQIEFPQTPVPTKQDLNRVLKASDIEIASHFLLQFIYSELCLLRYSGAPKHSHSDLFPKCYLYAATDVMLRLMQDNSEEKLMLALKLVFEGFYKENGQVYLQDFLDVKSTETSRSYLDISRENFHQIINSIQETSSPPPFKLLIYLQDGKID